MHYFFSFTLSSTNFSISTLESSTIGSPGGLKRKISGGRGSSKKLKDVSNGSTSCGIEVDRILEFDDDSTVDGTIAGGTPTIVGKCRNQFSDFLPLHVVFCWTLPKKSTDMVTVAMVLPQGVMDSMFEVDVVDGGMVLELKVEWPSAISVHEELHTKWFMQGNSMNYVDIRGNAFEKALKLKRSNAHEKLFSRARFPLPFTVRPEIFEQHNMIIPPSSVAVVYVDLISSKSDYGISRNSNTLEKL